MGWASRGLGLLVAAAIAVAGCGGGEDAAIAGDAETAGRWKTWVLRTPADVRVRAPSTPARGGAVPPDRSGVAAVEPWLSQVMTLVSQRAKDPVTASRNYALVAIAMYDAAVAAEHWQDRHGEGHPSTEAAVAGAASRVIAYAYPEHPRAQLEADAEAVAQELADSGGVSPPAAEAGLELGREVARRVIDHARTDGSSRVWRDSLPRGRGAWRPPPGSVARPVQPLGGTWRTWVLRSGRELRPPPPPDYGSDAFVAQAREVLEVRRTLTADQRRIAKFWEGGQGTELPPGRWLKVALGYLRDREPMSTARAARVFALLGVAMADAGVAAWDAKYAYWVTRPINAIRDLGLDRDFKPYLDTPFFPAYVSGHATYSAAAAEVLAHLFPDAAEVWRRRAEEASMSRLYGGIHFRMDNEEGKRLGAQVGRRVVAWAQRDGADR